MLIVGAGLSVAGVTVIITGGQEPAQAAAGGKIEHWGAFIGDGDQIDKNLSPVAIDLPARVVQVSSSNDAQYALLDNGEVYAWGQGGDGELGDGNTVNSFTAPVQVQFPADVKIAFLPVDVMPYDSAFAVDTTGHVWAWGLNQGSEFCTGAATEATKPFELSFSGVTTLAGAADHATYDANGTLYSCGTNQYGELGNGSFKSSKTPIQVSSLNGADVSSLVASFGDTGALLTTGTYYDWGENNSGQLGEGSSGTNSDVPVQVTLPDTVGQAAQGGSVSANGQTLVMLADGSVYAWGSDSTYQLGDGQKASEPSPELITPPKGVTYKTLATGGNTSYAITTTGAVYAWGGSTVGQVGDGKTTSVKKPVKVETGAKTISSTSTDVVVGTG